MRVFKAIVIAWTAILITLVGLFSLPQWYEKHTATLVDVGPGWKRIKLGGYRNQVEMSYEFVVDGRTYRGVGSLPPASDESIRGWVRRHPVGSSIEIEVFRPWPAISTNDGSGGIRTSIVLLNAVFAWLATVPPAVLIAWLARTARKLSTPEGRVDALRKGRRVFRLKNAPWFAVAWAVTLIGLAWWYSQPDWYDERVAVVDDVGPSSSPKSRKFVHLDYSYEHGGQTYRGGQSIELGTAEFVRAFARAHPVGSSVTIQVFRPRPWLSAHHVGYDHWFHTLLVYAVIAWIVTMPSAALLVWIGMRLRNVRR